MIFIDQSYLQTFRLTKKLKVWIFKVFNTSKIVAKIPKAFMLYLLHTPNTILFYLILRKLVKVKIDL